MSIRGLWVISPGTGENNPASVLFSSHYPTVERRAAILTGGGGNTVQMLDDVAFCNALVEELGLNRTSNKFVSWRDTCQKLSQEPVHELRLADGATLWPVLVIEQHGLLFCCLTLVEGDAASRPPLIQVPGITAGFSLLLGILDFLGQLPKNITKSSPKFLELYNYLCHAAPFGSPLDVDPFTVTSVLLDRPDPAPKVKQPAWKPKLFKGKPQIYFAITEHIKAVQYDKKGQPDAYMVYGTVTCKTELEGVMPDVTVNLSLPAPPLGKPLENILVHPCVQSTDTQILNNCASSAQHQTATMGPYKLRFTPPLHMITLCHYTSQVRELPIRGYYQMRGEGNKVKLLVQLKLGSKVKNHFEFCELQIPFYNRGPIQTYKTTPSVGSTVLSADRRILAWNIGQKFPTKSLEVQLNATVTFADNMATPPHSLLQEDPFCTGLNSYAQLYFRVSDYTQSGCYIDQRSIQVHPSTKHKSIITKEFTSSEYKIWNSHGDAQVVHTPPPTNEG
ncbi:AP-5 complex subunit mu-1-like [Branchiostoma floridae x Branchiostoma japonicum]